MPRRRLTYAALPDDLREAKRAVVAHYCRPIRSLSESMAMRHRIADLQAHAGQLIHAIGVGRKRVSGKLTSTLAVRFYLSRKLPKRLLGPSTLIPSGIDGIETDIIEAPPAFFSAPLDPCTIQRLKRQRPLKLGSSIGHATLVGGTLGASVRSRHPEEAHMQLLLSNNHVLADFGLAGIGSTICQPSAGDGGTEDDVVARLLRFVPVSTDAQTDNHVDAAVAVLDPAIAVAPDVCAVGTVTVAAAPSLDMAVHKHGRTTGYSNGVIDDLDCDVLVPLRRDEPDRVARFVHQLRIRARTGTSRFAQSGDSGALIVEKAGNAAVGLLFACPDDGSYAYANPIQTVLDALEVDLA